MKKITLLFTLLITLFINAQNKLLSSMDQFDNGSGFENNQGFDYEYDSSDRLISETSYLWNGSTWDLLFKSTRTYNTNSTVELFQDYDSNTSAFVNDFRDTVTSTNGVITELLEEDWNGSQFENTFRFLYGYVNGDLNTLIGQEWNGTVWVNEERTTLFYNSDNKVERIETEEWTGTTWEISDQELLTFNSNGFIITSVLERWDGIMFVEEEDERTTYTVDANGNRLTESFGVGSGSDTYIYDLTQEISDFITPFQDITGLKNVNNDFPFFNKILRVEESGNTFRTIYNYDSSLVLSTNDLSLDTKLKIYPNPTNDILNIESNQEINNVQIYNILGKRVLISENQKIDVSNLLSGVYMIKVSDINNQIETKRFIKN